MTRARESGSRNRRQRRSVRRRARQRFAVRTGRGRRRGRVLAVSGGTAETRHSTRRSQLLAARALPHDHRAPLAEKRRENCIRREPKRRTAPPQTSQSLRRRLRALRWRTRVRVRVRTGVRARSRVQIEHEDRGVRLGIGLQLAASHAEASWRPRGAHWRVLSIRTRTRCARGAGGKGKGERVAPRAHDTRETGPAGGRYVRRARALGVQVAALEIEEHLSDTVVHAPVHNELHNTQENKTKQACRGTQHIHYTTERAIRIKNKNTYSFCTVFSTST